MYSQKQSRASYLGLVLFLQLLLYFAQSVAVSALYNACGKQAIVYMAASCVTVPFVFLIPLWSYCKKTSYRPFKNEFETAEASCPQTGFSASSVLFFIFAVCAVISAVNVVGLITDALLSLFGAERSSTLPAGVWEFALTFVKTVVFAPILEELLFRGAIVHAFSDRSDRFKILISALLFALMHYSALSLPYTFVAGAVISFFAVKWRSLKYSIALHLCFNLTTFLLSVMAVMLAPDVYSAVSLVLFWVFLAVAAIGGLWLLIKARGRSYEAKPSAVGAIAPELVLYVIFALILSVLNF